MRRGMSAAAGSKRVMIIDDAAMMRIVLTNVLKGAPGLQVVATAENGEKALAQLKDANPDVIFVDIEMPEMDGLTFLKHARLKTRAKIIVLSSVAGTGSSKAIEARRLGADAVLQKPSGSVSFDLAEKSGDEILKTVRRLTAA
ncbi:MAG: response regulator [Myxococcota bacterium]